MCFQIVDYLIYEDQVDHVWTATLVQSNKNICVGKYLAVYRANTVENFEIQYVVKLSQIYPSLHYGHCLGEIIASPFLTKQLNLIKFQVNNHL